MLVALTPPYWLTCQHSELLLYPCSHVWVQMFMFLRRSTQARKAEKMETCSGPVDDQEEWHVSLSKVPVGDILPRKPVGSLWWMFPGE